MENLALYYWEQGRLSSIPHRSAGWLALHAGEPALARALVRRGLSIEPHPMIKPELEALLRQAHYAQDFPKCCGHGDLLSKEPSRPQLRHPGPGALVSGQHGHHAGYPDNPEWWFRNNPPNGGSPRENPSNNAKGITRTRER